MSTNPNPHIEIGAGQVSELLTALDNDDLLAYLRWSHWECENSGKPPFVRWGQAKLFAAARRELVSRGHEADSWNDEPASTP
ncbi:MAG: hypothetical protein WBL35_03305 [Ornithinibacter sp.]